MGGVAMQFGFALPHIGTEASKDAIVQVAQRAEEVGFDSVWVLDRLLWPLKPSAKYPGTPDGRLPKEMQTVYDPLTVLTFVAASTQKVQLGTSVLVAPYRNPVILAKIGATLDQLSGGRFIFGVGVGWNADEFTAVGQPVNKRGRMTDEYLQVVKTLWTTDEPHFAGKFFHVPAGIFQPKPLQKPHPPIWIGGSVRATLRRVVKYGTGWHPTTRLSPTAMANELAVLREEAERAGRDPAEIELSLRWNAFPRLTEKAQIKKVVDTLEEYNKLGVTHVLCEMNIPTQQPLAVMLETIEQIATDVIPALA
jgi:probable F420-dependent oxidoreductase